MSEEWILGLGPLIAGTVLGWLPWMFWTLSLERRWLAGERGPLPAWWNLTWLLPFAVAHLATAGVLYWWLT